MKLKLLFFALFLLINLSFSQQNYYDNFVDKPYIKDLPKVKNLAYLLQTNRSNISSDEFVCYSDAELAEIKGRDNNRYRYYKEAFDYYNRLSNYVKLHFTARELWYIYENDPVLKNILLNYRKSQS